MFQTKRSKSLSSFDDPTPARTHSQIHAELLAAIVNPFGHGARFSSASNISVRERSKPWLLHKQHKSMRHRVPLDKIENHEKIHHYTPNCAGRILVRLERLMGNTKISFLDEAYLEALMEGIKIQEQKEWETRRDQRIKSEINRQRQLVIDGKIEPTEGDEEVLKHPVFRVNRIMNRLSRNNSSYSHVPLRTIPEIQEIEPFHSRTEDELLFPEHENHYKRVSPEVGKQRPASAPVSPKKKIGSLIENESIKLPNLKKKKKAKSMSSVQLNPINSLTRTRSTVPILNKSKSLDKTGSSPPIPQAENAPSKTEQEIPDTKSTVESEKPTTSSFSAISFRESLKLDIKEIIRKQSLRHVTKLLKIDSQDLERTWKLSVSKYIDDLFDESKEDPHEMFQFADGVSMAFQREQSKTNEFLLNLSRNIADGTL